MCFFGQKLGLGLALHHPSHWSSKNPEYAGPPGPAGPARSPNSSKEATTASSWRQWLLVAPHRNLQSLVIECEKKTWKKNRVDKNPDIPWPSIYWSYWLWTMGGPWEKVCPLPSICIQKYEDQGWDNDQEAHPTPKREHVPLIWLTVFHCRPHHVYCLPCISGGFLKWINMSKAQNPQNLKNGCLWWLIRSPHSLVGSPDRAVLASHCCLVFLEGSGSHQSPAPVMMDVGTKMRGYHGVPSPTIGFSTKYTQIYWNSPIFQEYVGVTIF